MVYRTFTQTYDMNTEQNAPVLLGIHTPIGGDAFRFLYPFFQAYKKYKYVGCDVTIVNAARLPVDPEQLGKISGDNYIDPRDTLNPIMFKGCHGESLGQVLDSMYGGLTSAIFKESSLDKETLTSTLENFYYTAMGDSAWKKSGVQKTLRLRNLHPLVYQLATQHQMLPTNSMEPNQYAENNGNNNAPSLYVGEQQTGTFGAGASQSVRVPTVFPSRQYDPTTFDTTVSQILGSLFTNKISRLGWMDTLQKVGMKDGSLEFNKYQIAELPKIFMGIVMLPPAYLTRQYLRVVITHKFKFAGYRTITTGAGFPGYSPNVSDNIYGYANKITGNVPDTSSKAFDELIEKSADLSEPTAQELIAEDGNEDESCE